MGHLGNTCFARRTRRILSSVAWLVTTLRNGLKEDIIETNECPKAWFTQEEKN